MFRKRLDPVENQGAAGFNRRPQLFPLSPAQASGGTGRVPQPPAQGGSSPPQQKQMFQMAPGVVQQTLAPPIPLEHYVMYERRKRFQIRLLYMLIAWNVILTAFLVWAFYTSFFNSTAITETISRQESELQLELLDLIELKMGPMTVKDSVIRTGDQNDLTFIPGSDAVIRFNGSTVFNAPASAFVSIGGITLLQNQISSSGRDLVLSAETEVINLPAGHRFRIGDYLSLSGPDQKLTSRDNLVLESTSSKKVVVPSDHEFRAAMFSLEERRISTWPANETIQINDLYLKENSLYTAAGDPLIVRAGDRFVDVGDNIVSGDSDSKAKLGAFEVTSGTVKVTEQAVTAGDAYLVDPYVPGDQDLVLRPGPSGVLGIHHVRVVGDANTRVDIGDLTLTSRRVETTTGELRLSADDGHVEIASGQTLHIDDIAAHQSVLTLSGLGVSPQRQVVVEAGNAFSAGQLTIQGHEIRSTQTGNTMRVGDVFIETLGNATYMSTTSEVLTLRAAQVVKIHETSSFHVGGMVFDEGGIRAMGMNGEFNIGDIKMYGSLNQIYGEGTNGLIVSSEAGIVRVPVDHTFKTGLLTIQQNRITADGSVIQLGPGIEIEGGEVRTRTAYDLVLNSGTGAISFGDDTLSGAKVVSNVLETGTATIGHLDMSGYSILANPIDDIHIDAGANNGVYLSQKAVVGDTQVKSGEVSTTTGSLTLRAGDQSVKLPTNHILHVATIQSDNGPLVLKSLVSPLVQVGSGAAFEVGQLTMAGNTVTSSATGGVINVGAIKVSGDSATISAPGDIVLRSTVNSRIQLGNQELAVGMLSIRGHSISNPSGDEVHFGSVVVDGTAARIWTNGTLGLASAVFRTVSIPSDHTLEVAQFSVRDNRVTTTAATLELQTSAANGPLAVSGATLSTVSATPLRLRGGSGAVDIGSDTLTFSKAARTVSISGERVLGRVTTTLAADNLELDGDTLAASGNLVLTAVGDILFSGSDLTADTSSKIVVGNLHLESALIKHLTQDMVLQAPATKFISFPSNDVVVRSSLKLMSGGTLSDDVIEAGTGRLWLRTASADRTVYIGDDHRLLVGKVQIAGSGAISPISGQKIALSGLASLSSDGLDLCVDAATRCLDAASARSGAGLDYLTLGTAFDRVEVVDDLDVTTGTVAVATGGRGLVFGSVASGTTALNIDTQNNRVVLNPDGDYTTTFVRGSAIVETLVSVPIVKLAADATGAIKFNNDLALSYRASPRSLRLNALSHFADVLVAGPVEIETGPGGSAELRIGQGALTAGSLTLASTAVVSATSSLVTLSPTGTDIDVIGQTAFTAKAIFETDADFLVGANMLDPLLFNSKTAMAVRTAGSYTYLTLNDGPDFDQIRLYNGVEIRGGLNVDDTGDLNIDAQFRIESMIAMKRAGNSLVINPDYGSGSGNDFSDGIRMHGPVVFNEVPVLPQQSCVFFDTDPPAGSVTNKGYVYMGRITMDVGSGQIWVYCRQP